MSSWINCHDGPDPYPLAYLLFLVMSIYSISPDPTTTFSSFFLPPPPPPPQMPTTNISATSLSYDPIAESADKIFGMENFGNTCYCNSVLQCLYYLKPFRHHVLAFAANDLAAIPRRGTTPGSKPHPFISDSNQGQGETNTNNNTNSNITPITAALANAHAQQEARLRASDQDSKKHQLSIGRRLSLFTKKDDKKHLDIPEDPIDPTPPLPINTNSTNTNTTTNTNTNNNTNPPTINTNPPTNTTTTTTTTTNTTTPPSPTSSHNDDLLLSDNLMFDYNNPVSYSDYKILYPALRPLTLGMRIPTQNSPVVGYTDDPFASPELRKRSALAKGPIINLDTSYAHQYNMSESMFSSLKDIFDSMAQSYSQTGVVSPYALIDVLKRTNELFRSSMHQDAHEFLNYIINNVFENVDASSHPSAWIHSLFEGLLTSETKCLTCETVSRRDEQFLDLSIDIERNTSVTACLRQFSASETLCERNKFNCDHCGGFHEAQKRMKIKKLPKLLALHLKRFKFTEDMQRNVKLFHKVVYPRYLRLFNTTDDADDPEKLYELHSTVVHIGGGPYHGHYVSVVKTENAGWLLFDDEMVESVDPNYVFGFYGDNKSLATAYVLFYQEISQQQFEKDNLYPNIAVLRPPLNSIPGPDPLNLPILSDTPPSTNLVKDSEAEATNINKPVTSQTSAPISAPTSASSLMSTDDIPTLSKRGNDEVPTPSTPTLPKHNGLGLSRFKSGTLSKRVSKEHKEEEEEKGRRKSRHLSFGFKKH